MISAGLFLPGGPVTQVMTAMQMTSLQSSSGFKLKLSHISGLPINRSQPQRPSVCRKQPLGWSTPCAAATPAQATQPPRTPSSVKEAFTPPAEVDIDSQYSLRGDQIRSYRDTGFVKLRNVFDKPTLDHYAPSLSLEVKEADKSPLQQDPDYQQAFTQVQNLWRKNDKVTELVMGQRLARIAAELMGVEGVRLYADQALYKEPHGGYTPWHCDAFYWPLATDKAITGWIPLQATPESMGPMQFAAGSQNHDLGRHLEIGRESHKLIDAKVQASGLDVVKEPFEFGEVSFHSSLSFHKADRNQTGNPREVFTIIFMDKDMTLAEPLNEYQHRDRDAYFPELQPGELCHTALNPIIWSK